MPCGTCGTLLMNFEGSSPASWSLSKEDDTARPTGLRFVPFLGIWMNIEPNSIPSCIRWAWPWQLWHPKDWFCGAYHTRWRDGIVVMVAVRREHGSLSLCVYEKAVLYSYIDIYYIHTHTMFLLHYIFVHLRVHTHTIYIYIYSM